jgi:pyruvate-formate lyase-activating enzyme
MRRWECLVDEPKSGAIMWNYLHVHDEMRKTVSFTRRSANIFFHLLTRCNLRCRHCYINPDQHGRTTLSYGDHRPLADALRPIGIRPPMLFFWGVSPLCTRTCPLPSNSSRELGYGSVTVDTNGYLFHDILDRVTPEEVDFFSFSLDGPEPVGQRSPCGVRAVSSSARTGHRQRPKRRGFAVSLIYTVSRANIDHLHRMPPLLEAAGRGPLFYPGHRHPGKVGRSTIAQRRDALAQVDRDTWLAVIPQVAEEAARRGITDHLSQSIFGTPDETFRVRRPGGRQLLYLSPTDGSTAAPCAKTIPCTAWKSATTVSWIPARSTRPTSFP